MSHHKQATHTNHRFSVCAETIANHMHTHTSQYSSEYWQLVDRIRSHGNRGLVTGLSLKLPKHESTVLTDYFTR